MKILFLVPYPPGESPSQRFRFEQYLDLLTANDHTLQMQSFLPPLRWKLFYRPGHTIAKIFMLASGFMRRAVLLFSMRQFDRIFIHREAAPLGPPVIEWLIAKVCGKDIIYDFDDAIWLTDKQHESAFEKILRSRSKVASICRWSQVVSCGNEYLRQYALRHNANAILCPTTIDTGIVHNPPFHGGAGSKGERVVIAWTGSHSTLKYLYLLQEVLGTIQQKFDHVDLLVIADRPPEMDLRRVLFRPWSSQTEISDLMKADIGIMPLPDDEWSKGKCGFKALQYMALGIPAVVSNVGVNNEIIADGKNGRLCASDEAWLAALEELITDSGLRKELGRAGRQTVTERYSVSSNSDTFLSLFVR